jgi:DNA helicase II / ATP-dependent DNA helicase PcrA
MELTRRGIPFSITSGLRFFEQAHIKDVAAFLRLVTNRRDETSFKRIVSLLPGVGPASADKLWRDWLAAGHATGENPPERWSETLMKFRPPKKAEKHWEQLVYTLDELTPGGEFARPADMIFSVLEGVVDESMKASFDNYELRRADIEQLQSYAESFEDIHDFLAQLALMGSVDGEPAAKDAPKDEDSVTLSSIHQAKGLEWKAVFIIWLADGQFPNNRVLEAEDESMLEEERRLFYVAITRAKDYLHLVYPMMNPKSYSGDIMLKPSRFLDDFPASMVEEWDIGGGIGNEWEDEPF